jgi:nitrate/nitrite-specific signal transduction histidine kinase
VAQAFLPAVDTAKKTSELNWLMDAHLTPVAEHGPVETHASAALVNVRRRSGAGHVVVTFCCDNTDWKLSIQDDGRGFSTGLRARAGARPRAVLPPAVIHERVHSLGGTVRVVAPGASGARIEIFGHSGAYGTG